MASVHRRPKTKYWFAGWYDAQGRFHLRSTRKTDRKAAIAVALEYERAEKLVKEGRASETQFRKVLNDILVRTGSPDRLRATTTREWFTDWLRRKESKRSQDTVDRYRAVVNSFLAHLGDRADRPLTELRPTEIDDHISDRLAKASIKTAKLHLEVIRSALGLARRQGVIDANPAEAVEMPEGEGETHEPFTDTEVALLRKAADQDWSTLILLGARTGVRLTKLASLQWDQVDLLKGTITFLKPGKRGNAVVIPMHEEVRERFESLAGRDTPEEFVMPSLAGREAGGKLGLSRQFKALAKKAGVDMKEITTANGRKFCRCSFHSLRHTFVSDLANTGSQPETRRKLTGQKSASVHNIYTHLELDTLRAAINRLPRLPVV